MAEPGRSSGRTQGIAGTWPPRGAAQAGYAPAGFSVWPSFIETLQSWARAEAGASRLLPRVPVAFGTGIACYFAADHEPVLPVAAVAAIVVSIAAFLLRRRNIFPIAVMIAAVAAGFAVATWKAARVAHGVLHGRFIRWHCRALSRPATSASAPTASCSASLAWKARADRQNSNGSGCR